MPKAKTPRVTKPKPNKNVLQMPESGNGNGNGSAEHISPELQSEIRQRAYEIFAERGYAHGHDEQDWLRAEREVLAKQTQKHSA